MVIPFLRMVIFTKNNKSEQTCLLKQCHVLGWEKGLPSTGTCGCRTLIQAQVNDFDFHHLSEVKTIRPYVRLGTWSNVSLHKWTGEMRGHEYDWMIEVPLTQLSWPVFILDWCTCISCYMQISLQNSQTRRLPGIIWKKSYCIDKHSSHYPFKYDEISFLRGISLEA